MNVEGAMQHVIADLLGSVGVVISAILIMTLDWMIADPILSVVIAVLILYNTRRLLYTIVNVLLEGTPEHIDVYKLCSDIEDVPGVTLIHDVHVWTLTSQVEAFTAHILVDPSWQGDPGLDVGTDKGHSPQRIRHQSRHGTIGTFCVELYRRSPRGTLDGPRAPGELTSCSHEFTV